MQLMDCVSGKPADFGQQEDRKLENVRLVEFTPVIAHGKKPEVLPPFVVHKNDAATIIRTADAVMSDDPAHVFIAFKSHVAMRYRIEEALQNAPKLPKVAYSL